MDAQAFHHWLAQLSRLSTQHNSALQQALHNPSATAALDCLPAMQRFLHCQTNGKQLAS